MIFYNIFCNVKSPLIPAHISASSTSFLVDFFRTQKFQKSTKNAKSQKVTPFWDQSKKGRISPRFENKRLESLFEPFSVHLFFEHFLENKIFEGSYYKKCLRGVL